MNCRLKSVVTAGIVAFPLWAQIAMAAPSLSTTTISTATINDSAIAVAPSTATTIETAPTTLPPVTAPASTGLSCTTTAKSEPIVTNADSDGTNVTVNEMVEFTESCAPGKVCSNVAQPAIKKCDVLARGENQAGLEQRLVRLIAADMKLAANRCAKDNGNCTIAGEDDGTCLYNGARVAQAPARPAVPANGEPAGGTCISSTRTCVYTCQPV